MHLANPEVRLMFDTVSEAFVVTRNHSAKLASC